MRKFVSLFIAAVMLFNVPVYAASYASLNKTKTIRNDVEPSDQYLRITPLDEVSTGSSVIISFTNAKVPSQTQIDGVYQYDQYNWKGPSEGFWDVMTKVKTNELPYKIRRVGAREIQVSLINLPRKFADTSLYTVNGTTRRPVYKIRLPFISDGEGTIQIKINNNDSTISSATLSGYYVWAKGSSQTATVFDNTEGPDGEIIESSTEATTAAVDSGDASPSEAVSEAETETTTELPDIFDLNYNDYIAVRDLNDIIENSLFEKADEEAEGEEASKEEADAAEESGAEEAEKAEGEDKPETEFDLDVSWNAVTKTATITYNGIVVEFISYSDYYTVDDEIIYFDGGLGTVIIDGKMYVPAGLVIDALRLVPPNISDSEVSAEKDEQEAELN